MNVTLKRPEGIPDSRLPTKSSNYSPLKPLGWRTINRKCLRRFHFRLLVVSTVFRYLPPGSQDWTTPPLPDSSIVEKALAFGEPDPFFCLRKHLTDFSDIPMFYGPQLSRHTNCTMYSPTPPARLRHRPLHSLLSAIIRFLSLVYASHLLSTTSPYSFLSHAALTPGYRPHPCHHGDPRSPPFPARSITPFLPGRPLGWRYPSSPSLSVR